MSKPKWSAGAFARLVQISGPGLLLVVEGRDHDRPHYERLMERLPSTTDQAVVIRLAEHVEVGGKAAGGKKHSLALHDLLELSDDLVQTSRAGKARIVFMLDRDRDDYLGSLRSSRHVMYSHATDVEADILQNADIWRAVRAAYGIDSGLTDRVRAVVPDPSAGLVALWDDWLRLGLEALACGSESCAPWGQPSKVNSPPFDPVDSAASSAVEHEIRSSSPSKYEDARSRAEEHKATYGVRLLKGRWLSKYIHVLIQRHLRHEVIRANVQADAVIDTALMDLVYDGPWVRSYEARFADLVATT